MPPPTRPTTHTAEYVTLKDYVDKSLEARDKALEVACENLNRHLDATKAEYSTFKEAVDQDIRGLRESRSELAGKADQKQVNTAMILSVIGVMMAFISIVMKL